MKAPKALAPSLRVLITVLLLFLVFRSVDVSKIRHDLGALNGWLLALLVVACWIGQLACVQRWRLFAAALEMRGNYRSFVLMYFAGMLFNIGLPSLVGGDIVKAYILGRKTARPLPLGLASVLQDRAAGLISLLVYGTAAVLIHPIVWRGLPLWLIYFLAWIGVAAALLFAWMGERTYERLLERNTNSAFQKVLWIVADFHQALGTMRLSPGAILQVIVCSLFNSALVLWIYQQVSVATGHPVDLVTFSALLPLITLITMLPISLGGLGIREWSYVEAFRLVGVPAGSALLIALTTSALMIVIDLAGVFFLPTIPRELRSHSPSIAEGHAKLAAKH
jgi:uncharacterized protein (TIRG00374 family)